MTYWFKPAAVFLALLGATDVAFAAVFEQLAVFTVPTGARLGFSIASDCSKTLYYTNRNFPTSLIPTLHVMENKNLIASIPTFDAATNETVRFAEMAWDKGRGKLWAGTDVWNGDSVSPTQVYLLDPTTGSATYQFTAVDTNKLPDGLAYDGTDDTIWMSPHDSTRIYHYQTNGTLINVISPKNIDGAELTISGVVVGVGDLLYVGKQASGQIFKVKKSDGSFISSFPAFGKPADPHEGIKCDAKSFAPKTVV
jgi:hypothetical protein